MLVTHFAVILILFIGFGKGQNSTDECPDIRNSDVTLGGTRCCNSTYREFTRRYNRANLKLTSFMEKLRAWNCPQYEEECENRYFQFNRFTSLVYDRFCNQTAFEENCRNELNDINVVLNATGRASAISNDTVYGELIFSSPCLQVNAYDYTKYYVEVARPLFAFCGSVWCGFNENTLAYHEPSVWRCIPNSCRASIVIVMVVCAILALAVTIANLTVLIVISRNNNFPTSQMIYKVSLAAADLLVGAFVYPSFVNTLYEIQVGPFRRLELDVNPLLTNSSFNSTLLDVYGDFNPALNDYYRPETGSAAYNNTFGFFTMLSLFVSVSTLMLASYDRFRAISAPMTYDKTQATVIAQRSTIVLWIIASILGFLPIAIGDLGSYRVYAGGVLILVSSENGAILIGIVLGVPFIVVWILTVGINVIVKRQTRYRAKLMSRKQKQDSKTERRLSATLSIMVGVFSACILPPLIFTIVPEEVPSVNSNNIKVLAKGPASAFITIELVAAIIITSNSLWNCFIYSFRNKEFRKDAAAFHHKILSALGLIRLKEAISNCLYKTAHDGRRRISSVFTTSTAITDLRKRSSTPSLETESSATATSIYRAKTSKTKDSSSSAPGTSGLDSYV